MKTEGSIFPRSRTRLMRQRLKQMVKTAFLLKGYFCPLCLDANNKYAPKYPKLTLKGCDWCRFYEKDTDTCKIDSVIILFKDQLDRFHKLQSDEALDKEVQKERSKP